MLRRNRWERPMSQLGHVRAWHRRIRRVCCTPRYRTKLLHCRDAAWVESKMGAVAWGLRPTPRFPSPLIEPGWGQSLRSKRDGREKAGSRSVLPTRPVQELQGGAGIFPTRRDLRRPSQRWRTGLVPSPPVSQCSRQRHHAALPANVGRCRRASSCPARPARSGS
jgi:hypothetical protein